MHMYQLRFVGLAKLAVALGWPSGLSIYGFIKFRTLQPVVSVHIRSIPWNFCVALLIENLYASGVPCGLTERLAAHWVSFHWSVSAVLITRHAIADAVYLQPHFFYAGVLCATKSTQSSSIWLQLPVLVPLFLTLGAKRREEEGFAPNQNYVMMNVCCHSCEKQS